MLDKTKNVVGSIMATPSILKTKLKGFANKQKIIDKAADDYVMKKYGKSIGEEAFMEMKIKRINQLKKKLKLQSEQAKLKSEMMEV